MVTAALLACLAACGVPTGADPVVVDPADVPYGLLGSGAGPATAADAPPAAGEVGGQVALIAPDERLRLVRRSVPAGPPDAVAQALLDALQQGPADAERAIGLRSALPAGVKLRLVALSGGVATVDVTDLEPGAAPDRVPLAVGQVVLTVTSARGVGSVLLERAGQSVDVPRAGGGPLITEPLTRADFSPLLTPPSPPSPPSTRSTPSP